MVELEIKPTSAARLRVKMTIAISAAILFLILYLLAGGGTNLFASRTTLTSYMPDASGLIPGTSGSEVRLSGITIGYISSLRVSRSLDPQRAVVVEMRVLSRYLKNIPSDSETDISSDTLVGYQFLDIAEGKSPVPIGENGVLASQPAKQQLIRADLVQTLHDDLASTDQLLADITSGQTQIGKFVVGEELYDKLLAEVKGFDDNLHTFLTPQSNLGQAFYSMRAYDEIRKLVLQVDQSLASIQNGEGTAGRLFVSDDQYNAIVSQLTDIRSQLAEINAGQGPLGSMILDDATYTRIQGMLKNTDALLTSLNAGEGRAGRLLANAQFYESLNGTLSSMQDFLRDFRQNPQKYLRVRLRKHK